MHQLLLPRAGLHAAPQHPVQGGLGALQDQTAAGQAEVFQVYIEWRGVVRGVIDGLCNDGICWTGGVVDKWRGFRS